MVRIGSKALQTQVVEKISKQLLESFTNSHASVAKGIVTELLSETEERLLAKRLAAILMLIDEQSYYRIHQVLGMSTSTVKILHHQLLMDAFSNIEKYFFHKKECAKTMEYIALLLRGGLPPRAYVIKKRRW